MPTPIRPTFNLTLFSEHRYLDPDGMGRLRAIFKVLLRGFGMRCTWIEYPPEPKAPDDEYAYPLRESER